jgi:uncharacterized protein
MKVAVTGASGLIGPPLVSHLRSVGHDVVRLVRRPAAAPDEIRWDPQAGTVDLEALRGVEGVIHLAAVGVSEHRWTEAFKREILQSRVEGTGTIARAMTLLDPMPRVLVSASAIGWYGNTGDRVIDESSPAGEGFIPDIVKAWEAAAKPAAEAGIRVVHPRSGLVIARHGPMGSKVFPLFQFGLGGRLGSGSQYWSWISLRDEVCALQFLLEQDHVDGPVNLTAPAPLTNADVTAIIGKVLHRPTLVPAPTFALKAVLGEFSEEVLGSHRIMPTVLDRAGFVFQDPTFESAVRTALAS